MADNQKYYYMRLKEGFFEDDAIKIIEAMPDGYLFSNILLKLYLKSLKNNGKLMFNELIPYNAQMLATITGHQVGTVERALRVFIDMGLIEVLDNGAIYMSDIQKLIGKSSTEAERKKEYRNKIESEKIALMGQMSGQCPLEIEIEKEIEKEIELEIEIEKESETEITISKDIVRQTDIRRVVEEWNKLSVFGINPVSRINAVSKRCKSLKARIMQYGIDDVLKAIDMIKQSDFLQGKNKQGWTITFDWFVCPNNFPKVLEGNYLNRQTTEPTVTGNAYIDTINNRVNVVDDWIKGATNNEM